MKTHFFSELGSTCCPYSLSSVVYWCVFVWPGAVHCCTEGLCSPHQTWFILHTQLHLMILLLPFFFSCCFSCSSPLDIAKPSLQSMPYLGLESMGFSFFANSFSSLETAVGKRASTVYLYTVIWPYYTVFIIRWSIVTELYMLKRSMIPIMFRTSRPCSLISWAWQLILENCLLLSTYWSR